MAIALAQNKSGTTSAGSSLAVTFTSAVSLGSLLVATVRWGNDTNPGPVGTPSLSDPTNGSWTLAASTDDAQSSGDTIYLYYLPNSAAVSSLAVTFSVSGGGSHRIVIQLTEWSGVATASPLVTTSTNSQPTATSTPTTGSMTAVDASNLVIGYHEAASVQTVGSAFTIGSPWTAVENTGNDGDAASDRCVTVYQINVGSGSYNPGGVTFSGTPSAASVGAIFKAVASGTTYDSAMSCALSAAFVSATTQTRPDSFNRANGALGSAWHRLNYTNGGSSTHYQIGDIVIASNAAIGTTAFYNIVYRTDVWSNDQTSSVTFTNVATSGVPYAGVAVRANVNGAYFFFTDGTATGNFLRKVVASPGVAPTETDIPGGGSFTVTGGWANGDVCTLEAVGTTLNVYKNGVVVGTYSDTAIASGAPGMMTWNTGMILDSWSGTAANISAGPYGAYWVGSTDLYDTSAVTSHTSPPFNTLGATAIVVFIGSHQLWPPTTGSSIAISSVTDSAGNTYTLLDAQTDLAGTNLRGWVYYCASPVVASSHTLTVTLSAAAPLVMHAVAAGNTAASPIDAYSVIGGATGSNDDSSALVTCNNGSLLVGVCKTENTATLISLDGFTQDPNFGLDIQAQFRNSVPYGSYAAHFSDEFLTEGFQIVLVSLGQPAGYAFETTAFENTAFYVQAGATTDNALALSITTLLSDNYQLVISPSTTLTIATVNSFSGKLDAVATVSLHAAVSAAIVGNYIASMVLPALSITTAETTSETLGISVANSLATTTALAILGGQNVAAAITAALSTSMTDSTSVTISGLANYAVTLNAVVTALLNVNGSASFAASLLETSSAVLNAVASEQFALTMSEVASGSLNINAVEALAASLQYATLAGFTFSGSVAMPASLAYALASSFAYLVTAPLSITTAYSASTLKTAAGLVTLGITTGYALAYQLSLVASAQLSVTTNETANTAGSVYGVSIPLQLHAQVSDAAQNVMTALTSMGIHPTLATQAVNVIIQAIALGIATGLSDDAVKNALQIAALIAESIRVVQQLTAETVSIDQQLVAEAVKTVEQLTAASIKTTQQLTAENITTKD